MAQAGKTHGTAPEQRFDKSAILMADKFHDQQDLVNALLTDGSGYTMKEAEDTINQFLKGKVK